jgi:hypothetical protein
LLSNTDGFNDPIGGAGSALIQGFSFDSSNIHAPSMGDCQKKNQDSTVN